MNTLVKTSVFLFLVSFLTISCKKEHTEKEPDPKTNPTGEIIINGKKYTTVRIGNQIWTSSNYEGQGGIAHTGNSPKPEYGRYYSFSEIQEISVPSGWRIPTEQDFRVLIDTLGIKFQNSTVTNPDFIKKLTSKTNWLHIQGTNESGFNALPGGYSVGGHPPIDGDLSEFWMVDGKTFCIMEGANQISYRLVFYAKSNQLNERFNLRFVKDAD